MLDVDVKSTQASHYTASRPTAKVSNPAEAPVVKKVETIQPADFISSPKGRIDSDSGLFVIQFRDRSSGEVTMQFPFEKAAGVYKKAEALVEAGPVAKSAPAPDPVSSPAPAPAAAPAAPTAPSATETTSTEV